MQIQANETLSKLEKAIELYDKLLLLYKLAKDDPNVKLKIFDAWF
jgi:hypothetical protein